LNTDDNCCYTFEYRKECSLSFPRRVFVPWLAGTYICDYLQPSETLEVRTFDLMCKISSYVISCTEKEKKNTLKLLKRVIGYAYSMCMIWTILHNELPYNKLDVCEML